MLSFDDGPFANLLVAHLLMLSVSSLLMLLNLYNPSALYYEKARKQVNVFEDRRYILPFLLKSSPSACFVFN